MRRHRPMTDVELVEDDGVDSRGTPASGRPVAADGRTGRTDARVRTAARDRTDPTSTPGDRTDPTSTPGDRTDPTSTPGDRTDPTSTPGDRTDPTSTDGTTSTDRTHLSPRRRRPALVLGVSVLAVATVVAVVGQGVVAARERQRLASLTELPSALEPLDGPPTALWSGDDSVLQARVRTPEGLLVAVPDAPDGSTTVRALDPATGATVWETVLLDPADALTVPDGADGDRGYGQCHEYTPGETLVACLADNAAQFVADGARTELDATVTRLLLLDPRDGSVVEDLSDAVGGPLTSRTLTVVGELLVLTGVDDTHARVSAVARDGTLAWQVAVPHQPSPSWGGAYVAPMGDHLALAVPGELRILDSAGVTVRTVPLGVDDFVWEAREDAVVVRRGSGGGALVRDGDTVSVTREGTDVVRADATISVTGSPVSLSLDDGSVPGLLLTTDGDGLHAWDGAGDEMWTVGVPVSMWSVTVLDGRVHLPNGDDLVTLDASTGDELWRVGDLEMPTTHVTDGRHLVTLAPASPSGGGQDLVGIDSTDGAIAWRVPLAPPVDSLTSALGLLVAYRYTEQTAQTTVLG